jgi:Zinc finger, C2H2 type
MVSDMDMQAIFAFSNMYSLCIDDYIACLIALDYTKGKERCKERGKGGGKERGKGRGKERCKVKIFSCPHPGCTKRFSVLGGLNYHLTQGICRAADKKVLRVNGVGLDPFICSVCGNVYKNKNGLAYHIRKFHN